MTLKEEKQRQLSEEELQIQAHIQAAQAVYKAVGEARKKGKGARAVVGAAGNTAEGVTEVFER